MTRVAGAMADHGRSSDHAADSPGHAKNSTDYDQYSYGHDYMAESYGSAYANWYDYADEYSYEPAVDSYDAMADYDSTDAYDWSDYSYTDYGYDSSSYSYESTDYSYDTTDYSYDTTGSSYESTDSSYDTTDSSYDTISSSYDSTGSSYESTGYSYDTTDYSYDPTDYLDDYSYADGYDSVGDGDASADDYFAHATEDVAESAMSGDSSPGAAFGLGTGIAAIGAPPPPPAETGEPKLPGFEVGEDELFVYGVDTEVTSSGTEINGQILHGGANLAGFTITFSGAFSGTAITAADGTFQFTHYGSAGGLVEGTAAGAGLTSNTFIFFV